ncbi:hypothetical protein [Psychrobacter pygoscelis]|uniref:hypothetical protein n=1 Tax=Psychrobacter pygoscelis TaxID=2488563 RepID=UPI001038C122|nr:hypothetical protein [Psychrobacter pygoscelis]
MILNIALGLAATSFLAHSILLVLNIRHMDECKSSELQHLKGVNEQHRKVLTCASIAILMLMVVACVSEIDLLFLQIILLGVAVYYWSNVIMGRSNLEFELLTRKVERVGKERAVKRLKDKDCE